MGSSESESEQFLAENNAPTGMETYEKQSAQDAEEITQRIASDSVGNMLAFPQMRSTPFSLPSPYPRGSGDLPFSHSQRSHRTRTEPTEQSILRIKTEQRRALEQLRHQLDFTRGLTNDLGEGVYALDMDGNVTFMNPAAEHLLGWSESELLGRNMHHVVHFPDAAGIRCTTITCSLRTAMRAKESFQCDDDVFVRKDGVTFPVAYTVSPLLTSGHVTGVVLAFHDISERKRIEAERMRLLEREQAARAEAEEAQQRLAFLAEAGVVLSSSLDAEETVHRLAQFFVPQLADWCVIYQPQTPSSSMRVVTMAESVAYATVLQELEHTHTDGSLPEIVTATLHSGAPHVAAEVTKEFFGGRDTDGRRATLLQRLHMRSCLCVPLSARGNTLGVALLARTDENRRYGAADLDLAAELARRAAIALDNALLYQQTREALRQREDFLAIASHELRTPLTSLKTITQLTNRRLARVGLAEQQQMARVEGSIARMERLVSDLLDVSHIQSGKMPLHLSEWDLGEMCQRLVSEQGVITGRTVVFDAPDEPVIVRADPDRIEQVLNNLLSNAVKYSFENTPIVVIAQRKGDHAHISVSNEGHEIPEDSLPRLFEQFYRAPGVEVQSGSGVGLGLGLYLCRDIIERHGGQIWVEDASKGCTMTFVLPLQPEMAQG